ncbi:MAG: hypothetical protein A3E53_04405 [Gammaproteobacteria bacterium RIFCSPHIGHO2_12_FULL_39_24]|nr:MAG: hypothetical protein A3E53_04405 [Gammaproteobacteria bacterium RIFCSPHIGHO2_12_FULL_39_24]
MHRESACIAAVLCLINACKVNEADNDEADQVPFTIMVGQHGTGVVREGVENAIRLCQLAGGAFTWREDRIVIQSVGDVLKAQIQTWQLEKKQEFTQTLEQEMKQTIEQGLNRGIEQSNKKVELCDAEKNARDVVLRSELETLHLAGARAIVSEFKISLGVLSRTLSLGEQLLMFPEDERIVRDVNIGGSEATAFALLQDFFVLSQNTHRQFQAFLANGNSEVLNYGRQKNKLFCDSSSLKLENVEESARDFIVREEEIDRDQLLNNSPNFRIILHLQSILLAMQTFEVAQNLAISSCFSHQFELQFKERCLFEMDVNLLELTKKEHFESITRRLLTFCWKKTLCAESAYFTSSFFAQLRSMLNHSQDNSMFFLINTLFQLFFSLGVDTDYYYYASDIEAYRVATAAKEKLDKSEALSHTDREITNCVMGGIVSAILLNYMMHLDIYLGINPSSGLRNTSQVLFALRYLYLMLLIFDFSPKQWCKNTISFFSSRSGSAQGSAQRTETLPTRSDLLDAPPPSNQPRCAVC